MFFFLLRFKTPAYLKLLHKIHSPWFLSSSQEGKCSGAETERFVDSATMGLRHFSALTHRLDGAPPAEDGVGQAQGILITRSAACNGTENRSDTALLQKTLNQHNAIISLSF